jgi:hypothetical protein
MQKHEVKVLSYIRNFKKVIFICPLCRENNSFMLKNEDDREVEFRCDACRETYLANFEQLVPIIASFRK